jgi:DNA-directed RNA polymerase specialized sigma24 family protein
VSGRPPRGSKAARLQRVLAELTPREREALSRFYRSGQDGARISEVLGMTVDELNQLKKRVKKAFAAGEQTQ